MSQTITTIFMLCLLSGCSIKTVEPWQREILAQKKMQFDSAPLELQTDAQIESSRESAHGGATFGGGGCGCN